MKKDQQNQPKQINDKKKVGFLDDPEGDHSSKRLIAVSLAFVGICLVVGTSIISIFRTIADSNMILEFVKYTIGSAVAISVGGTAAEQLKSFISRRGNE
jgi:hypothetical protein